MKNPTKLFSTHACVPYVSDLQMKSEQDFPATDLLKAQNLPNIPSLIYIHGWHSISIVIEKSAKN